MKTAKLLLEQHAILAKEDFNVPDLKEVIQHFNQCNDFVLKYLTSIGHEKTAKKFAKLCKLKEGTEIESDGTIQNVLMDKDLERVTIREAFEGKQI